MKENKIIQYFSVLFGGLLILYSCNTGNSSSNNNSNNTLQNIVKDIDGNVYHLVEIGEQLWLKENLKVTHYQNGDPIPHLADSVAWNNSKKGAYCNYDNNPKTGDEYGRLYNWHAINDERGLCPPGWHVATYDEFSELCYLYGGPLDCGMYLKEAGTVHWKYDSLPNNLSGFTALPGGHRDEKGFSRLGSYAFFWNKEEYEEISPESGRKEWAYECSFQPGTYFNHDWGHKFRGMSIRCVKDSI